MNCPFLYINFYNIKYYISCNEFSFNKKSNKFITIIPSSSFITGVVFFTIIIFLNESLTAFSDFF